MKKFVICLLVFCFTPLFAEALVMPTELEVNMCMKAFDGKKSYWAFIGILCSGFVFTFCVLRLCFSLLRKKKDIEYLMKKRQNSVKNMFMFFVVTVSFSVMLYSFKFLPKKHPTACLDYKMCEEQHELYKYNINLWCYENIHLLNNYWNSTNSICLTECLAFQADKNSDICKKCESQHWQFNVFGQFKIAK